MTVRRALNVLTDRGIITASQGKGTYVRSLDMREAVFRLHELTDQWTEGGPIDVRVLEASISRSSGRVSDVLGCRDGSRVVFLRRLLLRGEAPVVYHREYVLYDPRRPLVEAQLQITTLEGLLQGEGSEGLRRGDLTVQAVSLTDEAAGLLGLEGGTAALCLEHVFYDFTDAPVSWGWFLCRADQFSLSTHIGPEGNGRGIRS